MTRSLSPILGILGLSVFSVIACGGSETAGDDDPGTSSSGGEPNGTSTSSGGSSSGDGSSGGSSSGQSSSSSGSSSSSSSSGQLPATCTDNIKNGNEADVDCGLACDNKCLAGQTCGGKPDCLDGVCEDGVCAAASDTDGLKNGNETDVDCGGENARKCSAPSRCLIGTDCVSGTCREEDGRCAPSYADGVKNQDETDIDCGGPNPAAARCAPHRACLAASDCVDEGNCVGNVCQAPSFNDAYQNLGESDVDCGGNQNPIRCGNGKKCNEASDCSAATFCNTSALPHAVCTVPVPGDGVTNNGETDRDCGGPAAGKCATDRGCILPRDCQSGVCVAGAPPPGGSPAPGTASTRHCAAPSPTDSVQNGDETDVDCGGANAPACAVDKACREHTDCESKGCHATRKVCVTRPSCAMTYGGDTCGGEAGSEAGGDSCCATADVQRTGKPKVALGKYMITAGRMRQFITRQNGAIRTFINGLALPSSRWNPAWTALLPNNMNEVAGRLGPNAQADEWPVEGVDNTAANPRNIWAARGCQVASNGGRPYWFNAGDGAGATYIAANETGKYTHDILDQKVLNCVMPALVAAFCIWDGGELADPDDLDMAWNGVSAANGSVPNTLRWPWGAAPEPPASQYGNDQACVDADCNRFLVNKWNYNYPAYRQGDSSSIIPAPGRRPAGRGPLGHYDLAGAGFEFSKRLNGATQTLYVFNSGSFETHEPSAFGSYSTATLNRRYWGYAAGRCAYPPAP